MQKDISKGKVTPGQFFVLKFDFSAVNHSPNLIKTNESLKASITQLCEKLYITYSTYLGEDEEELFKNIVPGDPACSVVKLF